MIPSQIFPSAYLELVENIAESNPQVISRKNIFCIPGMRSMLLAELLKHSTRPLVYVTASSRRALQVVEELKDLTGLGNEIGVYPSWETLPHERLSPRADTMAKRISALHRLSNHYPQDAEEKIMVAPIRALMQPVNKQVFQLPPLRLRVGQDYGPQQVIEELTALGYEMVDMVADRGQIALRGGIVDVFVPSEDHPQRIEFFGDTIEEIRFFSLADQRSIENSSAVIAYPCKELLLNPQIREKAGALANHLPGIREMLSLIEEGIATEGMESLIPVLASEIVPVLELLPDGTQIIFDDINQVSQRAHDLHQAHREFAAAAWHAAANGAKVPVSLGDSFQTLTEIAQLAREYRYHWWEFSSFKQSFAEEKLADELGDTDSAQGDYRDSYVDSEQVVVASEAISGFRGNIDLANDTITAALARGERVVLACRTAGAAKRYAENLELPTLLVSREELGRHLGAAVADNVNIEPESTAAEAIDSYLVAASGKMLVTVLNLEHGFRLPQAGISFYTEKELTGRANPTVMSSPKSKLKIPPRRGRITDPLALRPGDYVVHERHGVARFVEMTARELPSRKDGIKREYIVLEYAPSGRGPDGKKGQLLYMPVDQLSRLSRYSGSDEPRLNKIGGSDWAKTKAKARKATREIAGELIRIYAARQATKGHAFSPDTPWQTELEESFPYRETNDQLIAIDEIKADMEKPVPMDRLLCGDVGYGKTEVAVRAAFKAIQDGKQVAVLAPTTLLVNQHFETFSERYAPFPVTIGQLSRFSSPQQAKKVREGLASGAIDLVIGTHTLVSGQISFKNLGLVIIDEEQRFGVEHKETLKAIRTNVDVLAMSATPIPRTLEMAVTGIREMSTLTTPPEERHPILTFVGPYQKQQVKAAIRRELLRDGQVFFVHNRVETIAQIASELAQLVPEARIAIAHGKMGEKQLEQVMVDFWNREYDVLVCTTIVETGLDIANANTLIVDHAEKMGLSQLHQLRGRVGRAQERAYAYFFYPANKPLTETAHERLATIATHTDLGSGTAVAQKDLEIRGAGNLLGGEQSGHIAGVGFDLYIRMVAEAVQQYREGITDTPVDSEEREPARVELPVDAHIPTEYIASERLRLEIYQKLSLAKNDRELGEIVQELRDRYGEPPNSAKMLFHLANLRIIAETLGFEELIMQGKYVKVSPVELKDSQLVKLKRLAPRLLVKSTLRQIMLPLPRSKYLGGGVVEGMDMLEWLQALLKEVFLGKTAESEPNPYSILLEKDPRLARTEKTTVFSEEENSKPIQKTFSPAGETVVKQSILKGLRL